MLSGITHRAARLGPEPDITPDASLRELLAGKDMYSRDPVLIASFDEDLLRVTRGDVFSTDARRLLSLGQRSIWRGRRRGS